MFELIQSSVTPWLRAMGTADLVRLCHPSLLWTPRITEACVHVVPLPSIHCTATFGAAGTAPMTAYLLVLLSLALGGYLLAAMFWPEHF